jgi:drug/metabolite transporter (DMT)-like permease
VSMGVGALVLLGTGVTTQGLPTMTFTTGLIVAWLAIVNTAFAFTLWNATLRHLTAVESSVINNTMLIQIAALAWVFLGEALSALQLAGIAVVTIGTLVVQWRRAPARPDGSGGRRGTVSLDAVAAEPPADGVPRVHPRPRRRAG